MGGAYDNEWSLLFYEKGGNKGGAHVYYEGV